MSQSVKMVRRKVWVCPTHRKWEIYRSNTQHKYCTLCGQMTFEEEQDLPFYLFATGDLPYKFCKKCNNVLPFPIGTGNYCGNCGVKLTDDMIGTGGRG